MYGRNSNCPAGEISHSASLHSKRQALSKSLGGEKRRLCRRFSPPFYYSLSFRVSNYKIKQ